jgi:hypothetical protein
VTPPPVPWDFAYVNDVAPGHRWDTDILTPDGYNRFMNVVEHVRDRAAIEGVAPLTCTIDKAYIYALSSPRSVTALCCGFALDFPFVLSYFCYLSLSLCSNYKKQLANRNWRHNTYFKVSIGGRVRHEPIIDGEVVVRWVMVRRMRRGLDNRHLHLG